MRLTAGLAVSITAAIALASPAGADDSLTALDRDFWAWRTVEQPTNRDDIPRVIRPAGWAPDWAPATVDARRKALPPFEERWRKLADPSAPVAVQVDHRLLGSAIARVRWELEVTRAWRRDAGFYVDQTLGVLVEALLPPEAFDRARSESIVRLVASFPRTLEAARTNLDEPVGPFARLAIADLTGIGPRLQAAADSLSPALDAASRKPFAEAIGKAVLALDGYRAWLESRLPSMSGVNAVGRDGYLFFLRNVALMPFTPEELLAMGRQERDRAVAFEALERQRNAGLPELPLLPSQAAQVERARRDEASIRAFLDAKGVCTVPASVGRYVYRPIPGYLSALAGFGEGTDFTAPLRGETGSTRYIPAPSPTLGYFALSMAKDPRADMAHEGIPGHGFQMAISFAHDDPLRRRYADSGVNEGFAFYVEEMLFQMGLFDDSPKTREMLYSYQRLRALRVEVDVRLALGTFTIDQAAEYLRTNVPMDAATARSEAASFASTPGQAIGYQIGKLQIVSLLAEARRAQGEKFQLRAFHDYVIRNGNVPLALQRWELLGLRDQVDLLSR